MLGLVIVAGAGAARELSTELFANVFVGEQPVVVQAGPGEPAELLLRDLDGREITRRPAAGAGAVVFGPLPPGYYEVVAGETVLPLAVIIDPARRVPGESRLASDNAMSWLVPESQFVPLARLLRQCGLGWVRERLAWGHVERERGTYEWDNQYGRSLRALADEGIQIFDVYHGVPGWSRADGDGRAACDDLRDIHRFAAELAGRWRGVVQAWEVWNEPDISFFSHPASEMAAFQKAAWLGYRSVDSEVLILGPSMAHGACPHSAGLLENGIADYLDIWNWHIYADPSAYAARADGWRAQLAEHGASKPIWVTEAGDRVPGPDGVLTPESRRHQAAFLSRAFPQALAAGVEKHFWFIFPFYREAEIGWGLLGTGNREPFPGLPALAAATWALGRGDYLGRLAGLPDEARALAFARGDGSACLAVWREDDQPAELALPLDWAAVSEAAGYLGTPLPRGDGPVRLNLARAASYLLLDADRLPPLELRPPAPEVPLSPPPGLPAAVVRIVVSEATVDKDADAYQVEPDRLTPLTVQVYNFGAEPLRGELRLTAPAAVVIEPARFAVELPPGEMVAFPASVTLPANKARAQVRGEVVAGERRSSPAVVNLMLDLNRIVPLAEQPLGLDAPERWERNIAGHGTQTASAGADGGVRFEFAFTGAGDPWAYPQARFEPALEASEFSGVRFEYRTEPTDMGVVRFMAVEQGGLSWMTAAGLPGSAEWRQATIPFDRLVAMGSPPPGHGPTIDTSRLTLLRIGANCKPERVVLEMRGLRLVRW